MDLCSYCVELSINLFLQTVVPLIYCFGKGLCADGIDALVRIGIFYYLFF